MPAQFHISDPLEQVRAYTRAIEFDYLSWTLDALGIKLGEMALGTANYLPGRSNPIQCWLALDLIRQINQVEAQINDIYADPNISDPESCLGGFTQAVG